jgi:PHP family Zn ribbon phosphoesterase
LWEVIRRAPHVRLDGATIAGHVHRFGGLIGPAHAFTPWTAMYAYHDSLEDCYGDLAPYVPFVELGLSADTNYADRIAELKDLTFLTNSDAHAPNPQRLPEKEQSFISRDSKRAESIVSTTAISQPPQEDAQYKANFGFIL